ncbi:Uncharacterised protein [Mycobacteroides abscessus subsp. abscessus]|nr:Uncharacterised protein [Mycobacteroides abscessus subsp. abscessus]
MRFVAGVDDAALEGGLQADLDLDVVGALGQLEAGLVAGLADADPAGPADHLPGDEERRQTHDDLVERGVPVHQVVLVGAVGGALAVDVVLVQLQSRRAGHTGGVPGRGLHHPLARLVPDHRVQRIGDLGGGVLGVGVVDVEPRAVGEDHVRGADLVGVDHRRRPVHPAQVEATRVAQRRLHLVVPPGAPCARHALGRRVRQNRLRGGEDRVGRRLGGRRDAVFDLDSDDALHTSSLGDARGGIGRTRCTGVLLGV